MEFKVIKGYRLCRNEKKVSAIVRAVNNNEGNCPCVREVKDNESIKCPCYKYVTGKGCCCGLYELDEY